MKFLGKTLDATFTFIPAIFISYMYITLIYKKKNIYSTEGYKVTENFSIRQFFIRSAELEIESSNLISLIHKKKQFI